MRRLRPLPTLSLILPVLALVSPSAAERPRTCYFPDHSISNDVPCTSDTYTHCCTAGDICLDNGYCYSVAHQPYVLSRGSCTDQNWGADCPQLCSGSQNNIGGGCSITSLLFLDGISTYCCGNPIYDESTGNVTCPNGEKPFEMPSAKVLLGRAALANGTAGDGTANTGMVDDRCGVSAEERAVRTAIGAGVGLPLGVVALLALGWAFWERRARRKADAMYRGVGGWLYANEMVLGNRFS
ncbi:hypothetical protein P170DRAFT_461324 [Aspergillus steynii IBT 23096]|uniref:Mid2 domain-containing protein n=1 Tax=Aspergillus steynii IBT 23096 TaxID=1392250 RepID=A0A2I2GRE4_9EURO|nr:uncharacterized protein P170DRAFT_461324 [Aspergillus steynii IBT 23096]PLB55449.1 hypothetical protein P170DRAFT_461324 [Aspergillus steynii IBT 23096]